MPFFCAPLASTSRASYPFHIFSPLNTWPRASHCVPHCNGMETMSSAYRIPIDSWRPATASVPVASMVWMGLKRFPHRPFCGPLLSKLSASENTFPLRIRRAALMMSCGEILFSVPASSSAPHRPQFFKRSDADWISWSVTLSFVFVMSLNPLYNIRNHAYKLIDYHGRKFHCFALDRKSTRLNSSHPSI